MDVGVISGMVLMAVLATPAALPDDGEDRRGSGVVVNRVDLDRATIARLERTLGSPVPPGRYWYDARCGAWGHEGRGTEGFLPARLPLGGKLRRDASGGRSGVFINGRELHHTEVADLVRSGVPVVPGRFWLDERGVGGYEGQPPSFDLMAMIDARRARPRREGALSTWDKTGVVVYPQ